MSSTKLTFIKRHLWLSVNIIILGIFLYYFGGVYLCDKLFIYDPRSIPDPIFWGVYGDLSCNVKYSLAVMFWSALLLAVTVLGLVISWYKRCLRKNLLTSGVVIGIWLLLMGGSYFVEKQRVKNLEQGQLEKIQAEDQARRQEEFRKQNSVDNYKVNYCYDSLDTGYMEQPVIRVDCFVDIKTAGQYLVSGTLMPANQESDGYDNVLLETKSEIWGLGDESVIWIYFEYRHLARNKVMPDGPYDYEIRFTPVAELADILTPFEYSGATTQPYKGSSFAELPFKPVL